MKELKRQNKHFFRHYAIKRSDPGVMDIEALKFEAVGKMLKQVKAGSRKKIRGRKVS